MRSREQVKLVLARRVEHDVIAGCLLRHPPELLIDTEIHPAKRGIVEHCSGAGNP
jgi:hypothetical protein